MCDEEGRDGFNFQSAKEVQQALQALMSQKLRYGDRFCYKKIRDTHTAEGQEIIPIAEEQDQNGGENPEEAE